MDLNITGSTQTETKMKEPDGDRQNGEAGIILKMEILLPEIKK